MNLTVCNSSYFDRVREFLFCPFKQDSAMMKVASLGSSFFLTLMTGGLWLIPLCLLGSLKGRVCSNYLCALESRLQQVVRGTVPFNKYIIDFPRGSPFAGVTLSQASLRPGNFFLKKLFENSGITTTLPGSGQLFAFQQDHGAIRQFLGTQNLDRVIDVSARGVRGQVQGREVEMTDIFGDKVFQLSMREVKQVLDSQKIYVSDSLPLEFYKALKGAMKQDGVVILPGSDAQPVRLRDVAGWNMRNVLQQAETNPERFGFTDPAHVDWLKNKTLYQIGALVVKTEDFYIFTDDQGKVRQRGVGENDAVRLVNLCGIRGFRATNDPDNSSIMRNAFKTMLTSMENGYGIVPAVGMGVWRGCPKVYWTAFLNAVIQNGGAMEALFVNPRHQATVSGPYQGKMGEEFEVILNEFKSRFATDPNASAQLNKIVNLYDGSQDVLRLAVNLKKANPGKIVSLANASDPDVTLGDHVGQYVNNIDHATTTEENYTALGSNGLCFEGITGVHLDPRRVIQG